MRVAGVDQQYIDMGCLTLRDIFGVKFTGAYLEEWGEVEWLTEKKNGLWISAFDDGYREERYTPYSVHLMSNIGGSEEIAILSASGLELREAANDLSDLMNPFRDNINIFLASLGGSK